jgi:PKHD-type hydroxylase
MFIGYPRRRDSLHLMAHFSEATDPKGQWRLSAEECSNAIGLGKIHPGESARVEGGIQERAYRDTTVHFIPHNRDTNWLYHKLMTAAVEANDRCWQFDITGFFQDLQLLSYKADTQQHYTWHMDMGPGADSGRKISITVQLSGPDDYAGGDLELNTGKILSAPREAGAIVLFPSFMLHRVAPVTKGERWSVVGWVQGQDQFR